MSSDLPFDVIALIINIVGETEDTDLLKELALVSQSLHQICIKHLFATVELHDANTKYVTSSKKGFIKLVKSRPNVVYYIRKLTYEVSGNNGDDHLLAPILSNFLPTISRLNCLAINGSHFRWDQMDSSLSSAFLHLMSLPTMNHIDLSYIESFPLSSLTSSVNLLRLDISYVWNYDCPEQDNSLKSCQSETLFKIREFHTSGSYQMTEKLLDVKGQDGRPVFDFMDLRQLSISFVIFQDQRNIQCLLEKAKLLEKLRLSVDDSGLSLLGVLSTVSRTLKVLDLTIPLSQYPFPVFPPLAGLCEELEAMAGHNTLEVFSFELLVDSRDRVESIGSTIQKVENILVKPGWSALRQVSFKFQLDFWEKADYTKVFQLIPDEYLSHLPKHESIAFHFSAYTL